MGMHGEAIDSNLTVAREVASALRDRGPSSDGYIVQLESLKNGLANLAINAGWFQLLHTWWLYATIVMWVIAFSVHKVFRKVLPWRHELQRAQVRQVA